MQLQILTHLKVQRRSLLGVLVHSLVGGFLMFAAVWLLYDNLSVKATVIVSGVFAVGAFLIGAIGVMFTSISTQRALEKHAKNEKHQ